MDIGAALLMLAGIGLVVAASVVVGTLAARLFFRATAREAQDQK